MDAAIASRAVDTTDVDLTTIYDSEHTRPPLTWIDPKKEMDAIEKELALGITSRTEVMRRRGGDFEETAKKISEERKIFEELGITFATDTPPEAPDAEEEGNEPDDDDAVNVGDIVKTIDGVYLQRTEDGYEPVKI